VDFNTAAPTICSTALGNCPAGLANGTRYFPAGLQRRNPALGSAKSDASVGATYYNALTLVLNRRFSQGVTFRANYTWSKALDIVSTTASSQNEASRLLDYTNPRLDLGPTSSNITNRFSFSGSYELPIGKGKAFGKT